MAKLNGVVLTTAAIEYNGVKYEKIGETPKVGDILRVDDSDYRWVTEGAYYEVSSVDAFNDPQIIDNDGDKFDGANIEYTLFRKVAEPQTATPQQYREVKRGAEVGERIKIVAAVDSRYKNGDEFVVDEVKRHGVFVTHPQGRNAGKAGVFHSEYVVLEPIADDIIEVDGVKYRKVDRKPKVGDFVYATENARRMTKGKVYPIYEIDSVGDGEFARDNGGRGFYPAISSGRVLVERIATSDDLQRQVSELQTQLAEAESKLAAQKAEEEKAKDPRSAFAVGDKVRLISGGDMHPLHGFTNGGVYDVKDPFTGWHQGTRVEITNGSGAGYALPSQLAKLSEQEIAEMDRLKVGEYAKVVCDKNRDGSQRRDDVILGDIVETLEVDGSIIPFKTKSIRNDDVAWFREEALIRATDEEVAEARRKLELSKYSVGDYVKVLVDTEDLDEGAIGKVTRVDERDGEWPIKVELLDGSNCDYYKPEHLEKVTDEVTKWAAIGREVGEFKKGDVVEVTKSFGGHNVGTIGVVTGKFLEGSADESYFVLANGREKVSDVKLIAPVESVVNLAVAN